jgi:hypothetical protein
MAEGVDDILRDWAKLSADVSGVPDCLSSGDQSSVLPGFVDA